MKKILFVIASLAVGGAERSLISLLEMIDHKKYQIDLLVNQPGGEFTSLVPSYVNIIDTPYDLFCYAVDTKTYKGKLPFNAYVNRILKNRKIKDLAKKDNLSFTEAKWKIWGKELSVFANEYDIACAYLEGAPCYYVADKVKAKKKYMWIHNEFSRLGLHPEFQQQFLKKADGIITISELCADDLKVNFAEMSDKVMVLENLTSPMRVIEKSEEEPDSEEFNRCSEFRIISVGRVVPQKGYDLAIEAAHILKENGRKFKWFIIGKDSDSEDLKELVKKYELDDKFRFIGVRSNPYSYMNNCDLLVQSSRFEGKSIVLDEAKILGSCILATNYATVNDAITHNENGFITDMTPEAIADGIMYLMDNPEEKIRLCEAGSSILQNIKKETARYEALFDR